MSKEISGTREWATQNINVVIGCKHECAYCFARWNAVKRFKRVKVGEWGNMRVRDSIVNRKKWPKYDGTVMFPTTHDITVEVLPACLKVLKGLLEAKNKVLIVSKPCMAVVEALCAELREFKSKILFRFTIGSMSDSILKVWEPGAPCFDERFRSLKHAFMMGFETSVSVEPMLDASGLDDMLDKLLSFVTDAIWVGKMNKIGQRVEGVDRGEIERVEAGQSDESIMAIYEGHRDNPKVRWKESIKKVVGLPLQEEAGQDV